MQLSPATSIRLLKYESNNSTSSGVEVIVDAGVDINLLLDDLQWLLAASEPGTAPDFFVMQVRNDYDDEDFQGFAQAVAAKGLSEKICLVVPFSRTLSDAVLPVLADHGVRILLGGVGVDARFSDLIDCHCDGIVFDTALISSAAGDPGAASVLEAVSALAMHLGLRTFANQCSQIGRAHV